MGYGGVVFYAYEPEAWGEVLVGVECCLWHAFSCYLCLTCAVFGDLVACYVAIYAVFGGLIECVHGEERILRWLVGFALIWCAQVMLEHGVEDLRSVIVYETRMRRRRGQVI